jgi:hypothetical protein
MVMLVGGMFNGLTNVEVATVIGWVILPVVAYVLIVRRNIRTLKRCSDKWSPVRTIYFIQSMMTAAARSDSELTKKMDGGYDTPSDKDVALFRQFQKKCAVEVIASVILIALVLALIEHIARYYPLNLIN